MIIFVLVVCIINSLLLIYLLTKKSERSDGKFERNFEKIFEKLARIEGDVDKISPKIDENFRENRKEITENFKNIQNSNEKKLEQMRETVDEKLQSTVEKRFNASFATISKQLTQVYEGLGEMKNLANGVGDLKKVMEGVKTRGIYGEVQLRAIIQDMLTKNQYEENIITKKGSLDRVEFAIKMPGKDEKSVFLPVDSKFPIENYSRLIEAYDKGEKDTIAILRKALSDDIKTQAKKISTKYLDPPMTTDFGIMFLPTESLYAEILRIPGLSEEIRQKYNIVVTSPSTLPVILSGLLMGFRTLAIEKRSSEVWQILGAVKSQFGKFGDLLDAVQKKLTESAHKIDDASKASRRIERSLKDVESLPEEESVKLLGEFSED